MRAGILASLVVLAGCGSVPAAPDARGEVCFDGMDNEGDGLADCADPDCDPAALCVPSSAEQPAGVVVAEDEPCPTGFTGGETVIHRGLQPSDCAGCGCTPGDTTCTASVWTYDTDTSECYSDAGLTAGSLIGYQITSACPSETLGFPFIYGMRADISVESTSCTPNGTAAPMPSSWAETVKFCQAVQTGLGCSANSICVPRADSPAAQCALADGTAACTDYGSTETDWATGIDDQRTCSACFCSGVGGDCANVVVEVGSDFSCGNFATVGDGMKNCFGQIYSPPARLVGAPTPPTGCNADAALSGSITTTGQTTLCCAPQG